MARYWWWLLILAPLVAGGTAYWSLSRQQELYSATATLYITQPQNAGAQDLSGLQAGERLGATYQPPVGTESSALIAKQTSELSSTSKQEREKQIDDTNAQIAELNQQIQDIDQSADAASPAKQAHLASLRASLNQLQASVGNLLLQRQQMDLNEAAVQNRVTLWEEARVPTAPYAPRTMLYTALAIF